MPNAKLTAPPNPASVRAKRASEIKGKGAKRTPAEAAELLDLLADRVNDLEARLTPRP